MHKWEVWQADVEYELHDGHKNRPVIVYDISSQGVQVLPITSTPPRNYPRGDYRLKDWQVAGLNRASTVRCFKAARLPQDRFLYYRGTISDWDAANLTSIIDEDFMGGQLLTEVAIGQEGLR